MSDNTTGLIYFLANAGIVFGCVILSFMVSIWNTHDIDPD